MHVNCKNELLPCKNAESNTSPFENAHEKNYSINEKKLRTTLDKMLELVLVSVSISITGKNGKQNLRINRCFQFSGVFFTQMSTFFHPKYRQNYVGHVFHPLNLGNWFHFQAELESLCGRQWCTGNLWITKDKYNIQQI